MAEVTVDVVLRQILSVLQEAFEGPQQSWSYFTDNDPKAGFYGTLEAIGAENASAVVGQDTIASHVHHVVFGLGVSAGWIGGDRHPRNWRESWSVSTVDEHGWSELLAQLREGYGNLRSAIQTSGAVDDQAAGSAAAALAHAAYHLGAIQPKISFLRSP
jgi:hypothetical protein